MSVCVKAVCFGVVERKLHKMLLTGCMNFTRMHLSFNGNLYSKRPISSVRMGGTPSVMLCGARAALFPLKYSVPTGNGKRGLYSKSCSVVGSTPLDSQALSVSGCQRKGLQSTAGRREILLQADATWPVSFIRSRVTDASVSAVPAAFVVVREALLTVRQKHLVHK